MCIFYYRHPPEGTLTRPEDARVSPCSELGLGFCAIARATTVSKEVIYGDHFLADRSSRCTRVWLNFQGWCKVTAGPVREGRGTKKHWFLSEPNRSEGFSSLLVQLLERSRELEFAPLLNWENPVLLKGQLQPLKS